MTILSFYVMFCNDIKMEYAHAFKTGGGRRFTYGLHHLLFNAAEKKTRTFLLIKSRLFCL